MAATLRQHATGFAAAANTTLAATFDDPCLDDSLIVWIIGGDKNVGTITAPADTPNLPINLRSADVSLALAWGQADGGEETISGTVSTNSAGSQVWILEITDPDGLNAWARRLTITVLTADGGSNVTQLLIGPTGDSTTEPGIGIAAVAFDSVNTAGSPAAGSWDNGYQSRRLTNSGGGQAGLWGAIKEGVGAGVFDWTWFQRGSGATADQAHGFLVVFGREPVDVTGVLDAEGETPGSAALAGSIGVPGVLAADAEVDAAAALAGQVAVGGVFGAIADLAARADLVEVAPLPSGVRVGTPVVEPIAWRVGTPVFE